MKFEIRHRITSKVLFSLKTESIKLCVQAAVKWGVNLSAADLRGAYLGGANLRGAYLGSADLRDANLGSAYLDSADLRGANLGSAYLSGADLRGADLRGAYLGGANLCSAYLNGADLIGADLNGADLRGVKHVISLGCPGGWSAHAWLREGYLSIRIGCREFRLDEALKHWGGRKDRVEQQAAVEYAHQMAKARGWKIHPDSIQSKESQMLPYQQRVVDEKKELDEKREKLDAFKKGAIFPTLPWQEQELLLAQAHVMALYSEVLSERIAGHEVEEPTDD